MESEIKEHLHPKTQMPTTGRRLHVDDTIEPGDLYNSTNGLWTTSVAVGNKVGKDSKTIWIRPAKKTNHPCFRRVILFCFEFA
jgi:hypothetical protein